MWILRCWSHRVTPITMSRHRLWRSSASIGEIARLTKTARPTLAVITNIGVAHIEFLGSQEGIRKAKLEIVEGLPKDGILLLNGNDPLLVDVPASVWPNIRYFGTTPQCHYRATEVRSTDEGFRFTVEGIEYEIHQKGEHFLLNALAALAVGRCLGLTSEEIQRGLLAFQNVGLRQKIERFENRTLIVDCYNANPDSMKASLKLLKEYPKYRVAVLGDMKELGPYSDSLHREIGAYACECCDVLITYGELSQAMAEEAVARNHSVISCSSYEQIAEVLRALPEDAVVLFKASRAMALEKAIECLREGTPE